MKRSAFVIWFTEQFGAVPDDFDIIELREKESILSRRLLDVQIKIRRHDSLMMKWTAALYARNAFCRKAESRSRRGGKG